jgi:hypothetical protein
MKGRELVEALKRKLGVATDAALRRALGLSGMTLHNWGNRRVTPRIVAEQICRGRVRGKDVVSALKSQLGVDSLRALSAQLGVTEQAIQNWKNSPALTARQIAGLVKTAAQASTADSYDNAVRPLVEFIPIAKCPSRGGAKFELFSLKSAKDRPQAYLAGLQAELKKHHGVYVFFDSRGQAIYVGKARRQSLWKEMTGAFNRYRGSVQKIRRVMHPSRNQAYRTSDEKARQIKEYEVPLYELAAYFSVYAVADPLIEDVESLLLRSFANDVLNKRMERFGQQRAARKTAKKRRRRRIRRSSRGHSRKIRRRRR